MSKASTGHTQITTTTAASAPAIHFRALVNEQCIRRSTEFGDRRPPPSKPEPDTLGKHRAEIKGLVYPAGPPVFRQPGVQQQRQPLEFSRTEQPNAWRHRF